MSSRILIVDDEQAILRSLANILEDEDYEVVTALSGEEGLEKAEAEDPDLIMLDVWLPGIDGIATLGLLKEKFPALPVLMMSGHGTIETAVKATKLGAFDFIEKPLNLDKVLLEVEQALSTSKLLQENLFLRDLAVSSTEMVGDSRTMKELREQIAIVGPTRATVLITGENGTGKELVAKAVHGSSKRNDAPFVEVNCAAIPENLIESELFGHEKGAFTGATNRRRGKFDLADGGTLFLDEIGDMSLPTQAKILRVLQEMRFERVGGSRTYDVDVRIIAATNKDLEREIKEGKFREDLFFRLNVIPIHVEPLRNRREDIPLLVRHFVKLSGAEHRRDSLAVDTDVIRLLQNYEWPGNIRELGNVVERMVILCTADTINTDQVPAMIKGVPAKPAVYDQLADGPIKEARRNFEKRFITNSLEKNEWNVTQTASSIGMDRSALYKKMKELEIEAPASQ